MTTQISGDTGVSQVQAGSINPDDLAQKLTLAGALDRVRLTTVNGTDTFDGGSVNIMYEG